MVTWSWRMPERARQSWRAISMPTGCASAREVRARRGKCMNEKRPKDDPLEHTPPIAKLLGRTVIASDPCGTVELRFSARDEFTNRHGTIQGGILTAMLDSAGGMASPPAPRATPTLVTAEL